MAVDQLQETSARGPVEPAGIRNVPNDTGSTSDGRRRTLLFAAVLGLAGELLRLFSDAPWIGWLFAHLTFANGKRCPAVTFLKMS